MHSEDTFDSFLIGDGGKALMEGVSSSRRLVDISQLVGVSSVSDLKRTVTGESFSLLEDPCVFDSVVPFSLTFTESVDLFFQVKKKICSDLGQFRARIEQCSSMLVKERDLVVSEDDSLVLGYLFERGLLTEVIIRALAHLTLFFEMKLSETKVYSSCCPFCSACSGLVYQTRYLLDLYRAGKELWHTGSKVSFYPCYRYGDGPKVDLNGYTNAPVEFTEYLSKIDLGPAEFVDFEEKRWFPDVVRKEDKFYIHNKYVGMYSPLDYVTFWNRKVDVINVRDIDFSDLEVYFYKGKRVVQYEGNYIDVETKEVVK